jgi:putative DNA primase/helicase
LRNRNELIDLFVESNFALTPLDGKEAHRKGWTSSKLDYDTFRSELRETDNIGVVLGDMSDGLVDVDLDHPVAVRIAHQFLPKTDMKFGRASKPASHWIFKVPAASGRKTFDDPEGEMLVELRGNGSQTMFPGSVHPSGEPVSFYGSGAPAELPWTELYAAVQRLAIATLLVTRWNSGKRHELALAVSGFLARNGWDENQVAKFIEVVASESGDSEIDDRLNCVGSTFDALREDRPIAGESRLVELIGEAPVTSIRKWLGVRTKTPPASSVDRPELSTDAGCAKAFAQHYQGQLIYSERDGEWLQRRNNVFSVVSTDKLQQLVMALGPEMAKADPSLIGQTRKFSSLSGINAIIQLSRSFLAVDADKFDAVPALIGCKNGVLSLEKGQLVEPDGEIITKKLGTKFDPAAKCPHFENFVSRIFSEERDVIQFVQRAIGYSLFGEASEQCLFVLIGTGANGKSTLLNVLSELLGEYAGAMPMQTLMVQKFSSQQTNDLAGLVGKRLVSASEGEANSKLAESKIKLMTGSDPISCRKLYKEFFAYVPQFKLWLATNELPKIDGTNEAIWRRIHVINFPVTIAPEQRDRHLPKRLKGELSGILNWALDGFADWQRLGLAAPELVTHATDAYRSENDSVRQFVDACCERDQKSKHLTSELHASYVIWASGSGEDKIPMSRFGKELGRMGFESYKSAKGNGWRGLSIKDDAAAF